MIKVYLFVCVFRKEKDNSDLKNTPNFQPPNYIGKQVTKGRILDNSILRTGKE